MANVQLNRINNQIKFVYKNKNEVGIIMGQSTYCVLFCNIYRNIIIISIVNQPTGKIIVYSSGRRKRNKIIIYSYANVQVTSLLYYFLYLKRDNKRGNIRQW